MNFPNHSDKCPLCAGNIEAGTTTFSADIGTGVVVIRHVPALVCRQCGEDWIQDATAAVIEEIIVRAKSRKVELEMVSLAG